jgi:hypothetical protein
MSAQQEPTKEQIMARTARIFQTQITAAGVSKPMKSSFSTEGAARTDIARSVTFSKTERGQVAWGNITSAVIFNKETGETITVI